MGAPKKTATTGAALAIMIAAPFTAQHEGLRLSAYLDPVGIATICYGETEGIRLGDEMTKDECDSLFKFRLGFFAQMVDLLIEPDMKPETHAALTSFTYNVGITAFRNSTLRKKMNEGKFIEACNELMRWKFAGGRELQGLINRREAEKVLCLKGGIDVRA